MLKQNKLISNITLKKKPPTEILRPFPTISKPYSPFKALLHLQNEYSCRVVWLWLANLPKSLEKLINLWLAAGTPMNEYFNIRIFYSAWKSEAFGRIFPWIKIRRLLVLLKVLKEGIMWQTSPLPCWGGNFFEILFGWFMEIFRWFKGCFPNNPFLTLTFTHILDILK